MKNRFGSPNKYLHYLFDGASNTFTELPASNETQKLIPFYDKADVLQGRTGVVKKMTTGFGS